MIRATTRRPLVPFPSAALPTAATRTASSSMARFKARITRSSSSVSVVRSQSRAMSPLPGSPGPRDSQTSSDGNSPPSFDNICINSRGMRCGPHGTNSTASPNVTFMTRERSRTALARNADIMESGSPLSSAMAIRSRSPPDSGPIERLASPDVSRP